MVLKYPLTRSVHTAALNMQPVHNMIRPDCTIPYASDSRPEVCKKFAETEHHCKPDRQEWHPTNLNHQAHDNSSIRWWHAVIPSEELAATGYDRSCKDDFQGRTLTVPPSFLTRASISCLLCWPWLMKWMQHCFRMLLSCLMEPTSAGMRWATTVALRGPSGEACTKGTAGLQDWADGPHKQHNGRKTPGTV